jgi:hypothetical protein
MLRYLWLSLALALHTFGGCAIPDNPAPHANTLLRPIDASADGIQLEVISVRFPYADPQLNSELWNEIDEQQFSPAVRRGLNENGMRVGIISGELPAALAQVIAIAEQPPTAMDAAASLEHAPIVSRQQMQLHSGWHGQVFASNVYPDLPLLMSDNGQTSGRTYSQAQCAIDTKVLTQSDKQMKLEFTPEIQHGEARQQWQSDDSAFGGFRPQTAKPKRVFDRLAFQLKLAGGQTVIMTTLADRPGSLGHYFFTDERGDQLEQKLLLIRLAGGGNDLFAPAEPPRGDKGGGSDLAIPLRD